MTKGLYLALLSATIVSILFGMCVLRETKRAFKNTPIIKACPQSVRKRHIEETCRTKNLTGRSRREPPASLLIDHRHKLAYCLVPKAASRTIRSVLGSDLTGNDSYNPDHDFTRLQGISVYSRLPAKLQKEVIENYKKLIVVRHPYSRLVSVFDSKLQPSRRNMIADLLGRNVLQINRYLTKLRGKEIEFDPAVHDLSFEEFVGVLSSEYYSGFRNNHWNAMFEHCNPCTMNYDLVLRLETMERDYQVLATYLRLPMRLRRAPPYLDKMRSSLLDPDEKMFDLLWRYENLPSDILVGLRNIYRNDLDVFGYTWNDQEGASCRIPLGDGTYCC